MEYLILNSALHLTWKEGRLRSKQSMSVYKPVQGLSDGLLGRVGERMVHSVNGMSFSSTKDQVAALHAIFWFLTNRASGWPNSDEWPTVIFNLYSFQLIDKRAHRKVKSSLSKWSQIRRILQSWMAVGIIPENPLPSSKFSRVRKREFEGGSVLGEILEEIPPAKFSDAALPKQSLRDLSYVKDDDEFFCDIEDRLQHFSDIALEVCVTYWQDMLEGHELGRRIIDKISREELLEAIADPRWQESQGRGRLHVADSRSKKGMSYFLAAIDYYFFEKREIQALSIAAFRKVPFLRAAILGHGKQDRMFSSLRTATNSNFHNADQLICRALGILTTRDCAAAAGILIHEQPKFTVEGVECADLVDKHGKSLIETADESGNTLSFTIAKHRARSRKGGRLTAIATSVLRGINLATKKLRGRVEIDQPHVASRLLLVATAKGFGHVGRLGTYINSMTKPCVFDTQSIVLLGKGFSKKTFTLSRIRKTEGLLVWLRTGSMLAASDVMGHGVKIFREHYIPDWIQQKMFARVARRLHQKIIILATAYTDWQLDASDFVSLDEFQSYLSKALIGNKRGDPLSDEFAKVFAAESEENSRGDLYLSLTPETLAALEVYVKHAMTNVSKMKGDDIHAKPLNGSTLIDLYQVIFSVVHETASSEAEEIIHELISGGSRAQLRSTWLKSRAFISLYEGKAAALK